ncbi:MFS transporter [Conexibacter sp. SYSU D00693]|uniref:MFS transporter n=1 Tax=Conexibacter sp. SYSU D00693 TaxID=2812560 RepID=UPI001F119939|nr:MFS transporter [Conexibacter sp. SYSU D00693]
MTSSTTENGSAATRLDARAWGALLVLCGALFLDGLDVSMVGVALPSIDADLDLSTSTLQWVVSGYVLGYGGLLLLGGRAADLLGRRRVFVGALVVFALASLLGGLSSDGTVLIATRFIKGLAAAFTAPAGLSIITTTFPEGPLRNKALAIYTATGASGFSLGLIMGGLLTTAGWRWTFLLPAPIALLLAFLAPRLIRADKPLADAPKSYDLAGAVTVTGAMLALVFTVVRAPDVGWSAAETLVGFAAVVALLVAFVVIERRVEHPLLRLGILKTPGIVHANLAAMAVFGSYVSFQFLVTLHLQQTLGWSALETALGFLPGGLIVAFTAPNMGRVIDRLGTRRVLAAGLLAFTVGYALFLRIDSGFGYASVLLPTMLLIGSGFALAFPALNVAATTGVADHEQGLASGLVNTSFQVGGAIVLAVVTAIVAAGGESAAGSGALPDGYLPGLEFVTAMAALGLIAVSAGSLRRRSLAPSPA